MNCLIHKKYKVNSLSFSCHFIPFSGHFYSTLLFPLDRSRFFYLIQINFKAQLRSFSFYNNLYDSVNPLLISDGTFSHVKDIKLDEKIRWVAGRVETESVGKLGWFGEEISLSGVGNFKENVIKLTEIFKSFSPLNSYSLAIMVHKNNNIVKTIDYHYLVNSTTNVSDLMENVYRRIAELNLRYRFEIGDIIVCRYKALYFKVKDPKFIGGRIDNTIYKPTEVKLDIQNRILSSSFLPHTMDPLFYGVLYKKDGNVFYFIYNNKYYIKLTIINWKLEHEIQVLNFKTFNLIAEFVDLAHEDGFIREVISGGSSTYLFYNNRFKLLNLEFTPKIKYLTRAPKEIKHNINILTFDIETYKDYKGDFIPYACGFFDGKNKSLFYLTDFNSPYDMIYKCLDNMLKPKYHNYTVYAHNLGNFDVNFIFKILVRNFEVSRLIARGNSLIYFEVKRNLSPSLNEAGIAKLKKASTVKLKFLDSICLLPSSLAELGNSFKVETLKDFFPYNFVRADNLNYIGSLPDIKYFDQPSGFIFRYQLMVNWYKNDWSLRCETLNYLSKDLISLYQILVKMDNIIYSNYRINITSHITIASLAIKILRSNFLKSSRLLPKSKGEIEFAIRSSYYGGRCEVFKPFGHFLMAYDFNSLYPYAMLQDMPVGQPTFSLTQDLSKIFGFIKVKVTSPDNLYVPVLPCKVKNPDGVSHKLIFPLGSWTGWYFSEEVKLAILYGYKVEVIESYIYERGKNIFYDYVKQMASIKDSSSGAMRNIHKLLLNTPYGRMGMNNDRPIVQIVSKEQFQELELRYNITYFIELDEDKVFVKYDKFVDKIKCEQTDADYEGELLKILDSDDVNNSPAIASAVTSWARILMYPKIINSYYTDTDSIFLDKPLNPKEIGKNIGEFKQEYGGPIKKAIFPSPKLYILDTVNGLVCKAKGYSGGKLTTWDYMDLYKGGFIEVKDIRWKRDLGLETVSLQCLDYTISGQYDKRNKLYSKGRWVNTSPLIINPLFEIVNTNIVLFISKPLIGYSEAHRTALDLIIYLPLCSSFVTINLKPKYKFRYVGIPLEDEVSYAIRESMMLAGNEAQAFIYRLTGILYFGNEGSMYYFVGKGHYTRSIYITKGNKWINPYAKIEGGYLYLKRYNKWIRHTRNCCTTISDALN